MLATAVLLLWPLVGSVSGTCLNPIACACGRSNQSVVLCAEEAPLEDDPCDLLSNCQTCKDELNECLTCPFGLLGTTCSIELGRKATRVKRQTQIGNCPILYPPENGQMECRNARRHGYCRASCNRGFTFQGKEDEPELIMECQTRGEWKPKRTAFPPCIGGVVQANCTDPGIPLRGTRSPPRRPYPGIFDWDEQLAFGCTEPDTVLRGESVLTCQMDGTWSAPVPECVVEIPDYDCPFPGEFYDGSMTVRGRRGSTPPGPDDFFRPGTRLLFVCNPGFSRQGPRSITCRPSGNWSENAPFCVDENLPEADVYCPNLGPVHYGTFSLNLHSQAPNPDKELPAGTEVTYECRRGYILQGSPKITCQENGRWTAALPSCVEGCGLRSAKVDGLITHGQTTVEGEWPWMVSLSKLSANNVSDIFCGGALLDSRTVLTAAHCFPNSTWRDPVLLHFGKFYRSTRDDGSEVKSRWSQRIRIHPDFDPATYDNDIALIRFSPSIRYDERILPICRPTLESTRDNLVPQNIGIVTGWGRNHLGTDPVSLMRAHLPVQSSQVCEDSYRPLFYNPRTMLCAGYPEGKISTCRGDSGSGLVFQDQHSEGRFVVEGIVSYNIAGSCGQPGRYTAFTRVSRFTNWINDNI